MIAGLDQALDPCFDQMALITQGSSPPPPTPTDSIGGLTSGWLSGLTVGI